MSRTQYLFQDSSRVYKQAKDLATGLRQLFKSDGVWFAEAAAILESNGLSLLQHDEQWQSGIDLAKQHVDAIAHVVDPRIAIPALLEAVDDFYYRDASWRVDAPICGSAMKATLAVIWPNQWKIASDKSAGKLYRLVSAVMAWQQLIINYDSFRVLKFRDVRFTPSGFEYEHERDVDVLMQWNAMASPYGQTQRTVEHSKAVIFDNPQAFSRAVSLVLSGEKPSEIK